MASPRGRERTAPPEEGESGRRRREGGRQDSAVRGRKGCREWGVITGGGVSTRGGGAALVTAGGVGADGGAHYFGPAIRLHGSD